MTTGKATTCSMGCFKGDPKLRNLYINRMISHGEADEIIQGETWNRGKGCFIGCAFHKYDHSKFQSELNAPEWLARLADRLFEGQENKDAQKFAVVFFKHLQVGTTKKQFNIIKWKFLLKICQNVIKLIPKRLSDERKEQISKVNLGVQKVLKAAIKSGVMNEVDLADAYAAAAYAAADAYAADAAADAYADAAYAAAYAAAAYAYAAAAAAYAAAYADAYAAAAYAAAAAAADAYADAYADASYADASYAAAAAYAAATARKKAYKNYANYLLKLLKTKGKS